VFWGELWFLFAYVSCGNFFGRFSEISKLVTRNCSRKLLELYYLGGYIRRLLYTILIVGICLIYSSD